jgi:hypothetical protein
MAEHHHSGALEQGVIVDVGPGVGALVIYTREELKGQEIEISPKGDDTNRVHTDVLRRRTVSGLLYGAVFGSLPEADRRLWNGTLTRPTEVRIVGGEVTESTGARNPRSAAAYPPLPADMPLLPGTSVTNAWNRPPRSW